MSRAYLYTLLAVFCWTTGPVGSKAALLAARGADRLTPIQVAFWAIGVGWLALLAILAARGRLALLGKIRARGWLTLLLMGGFGWAGYPVAMNFAYRRLPLPEALVISFLCPAFVILFQASGFGRVMRMVSGWEETRGKPEPASPLRIAAGLAVCMFGVAVIATRGDLSQLRLAQPLDGVAAALFGAVAWGVYSNLGRFVPVRPGTEARGLGDVQNFAAMTVGLLVMGAALAAGGRLAPPSGYEVALYLPEARPLAAWTIIVVMGVVNYAAGYTLWLWAVEMGERAGGAHRLPPLSYLVLVFAVAGGWLVLHDVFAVAGGWLVLHEPVGAAFWPGAGMIAAGNAVTLWRGRRMR